MYYLLINWGQTTLSVKYLTQIISREDVTLKNYLHVLAALNLTELTWNKFSTVIL